MARPGDRQLLWIVDAHPLIDGRMFADAALSAAVGRVVLAMPALVGLELIAVQHLQRVLGSSPPRAGLRPLPLAFAATAAGLAGSRTRRAVGRRRRPRGLDARETEP